MEKLSKRQFLNVMLKEYETRKRRAEQDYINYMLTRKRHKVTPLKAVVIKRTGGIHE